MQSRWRLCIAVQDLRTGGVYLVQIPKAHQTPKAPRRLATTFSELLDRLVPATDNPVPHRPTVKLRRR